MGETEIGLENSAFHSDELSTVERIALTGPDTITYDATLYDPKALRTPWHTLRHYARETEKHDHVNWYMCDANVWQSPDGNSQLLYPGETVTLVRHWYSQTHLESAGGYGDGGGVDAVIATGAKILGKPLADIGQYCLHQGKGQDSCLIAPQ
jgi:hypothetical protein